jgi:Homeodomain-like domain
MARNRVSTNPVLMPSGTGRPVAFKLELGAHAERLLADGYSLRRAAGEVGVSRRTLGRWLDEGLVARPQAAPLAVVEGVRTALGLAAW